MKFTIYEVQQGDDVISTDPDRSCPLGDADSREQAESLVSAFPGCGRCFVWDHEAQRVVVYLNYENRRSSN